MSEKKEWYVDFGTWIVEAEDASSARKKAEAMLAAGENPPFAYVEEV